MSTFQIFPNFGQGGGHRKSNFSQIQNSPHYPKGGGCQENYGLFPQFVTFPFWIAPLRKLSKTTKKLSKIQQVYPGELFGGEKSYSYQTRLKVTLT